jgi:hypothetical protein
MPKCVCNGFAVYGEENGRPTHCGKCKVEGMVDVKSKRCDECDKFASFGFPDGKLIKCGEHKDDGMVNLKTKKCDECETRASCGFPNSKATKCIKHTDIGMVNLKNKRCQDCDTTANFGFPNGKKIKCGTHKDEGMVNVASKKCDECDTTAGFGFPNGKATKCVKHTDIGMINVRSKKCDECDTEASFGFPNGKAIKCGEHKDGGMANVVSKKCVEPNCLTSATGLKYEGYCFSHYFKNFPDAPKSRNHRVKELATTNFIVEHFTNLHWIVDKKIQNTKSLRRPDILLDLGEKVVVIEIDENQHKGYIDDNERVNQITTDLKNRPIILIRFNPDAYLDKNKKKVASCWGFDGERKTIIKATKGTEWKQRLEVLKNTIEYWVKPENKLESGVEVVKLFFDYN